MKKTKKAVSLILAFAMVLSAMLGCMTVSSFAGEGPVIKEFYFEDIDGPKKGEAGQTIKLNIVFNKEIKVLDEEKALGELDIEIAGGDVKSTARDLSLEAKENILSLEMVSTGWAAIYGGTLFVGAQDEITQIVANDGVTPVEWTDFTTYIPIGIKLDNQQTAGTDSSPASTVVEVTHKANMRGMYHFQLMSDGEAVLPATAEYYYAGAMTSHAHNFNTTITEEAIASAMAAAINNAGADYKAEYEEGSNKFTVTALNAKDAEKLSVQMLEADTDLRDQKSLLAEAYDIAKSTAGDNSSHDAALEAYDQFMESENKTQMGYAAVIAQLNDSVEPGRISDGAEGTFDGSGELSFDLDSAPEAWTSAVTTVEIQEIIKDQTTDVKSYTKDEAGMRFESSNWGDSIVLNSDCFDNSKNKATYKITLKADGYLDSVSEVSLVNYSAESFQLRIVGKDGVIYPVKTYTKSELEEKAVIGEYQIACGMAGVRNFIAKGVLLTDLLQDAGVEVGPGMTIQLRTNDQATENDSFTENAYYRNGEFTYENLLGKTRYYFPGVFESKDFLSAVQNQTDGRWGETVRKALAATTSIRDAVAVTPMICTDYVEKIYSSDQKKPTEEEFAEFKNSDERSFRFLFGLAMDEKDDSIVASKTTTWSATYAMFGIDIIDPDYTGAELKFDVNASNAKVELKDFNGTVVEANDNGDYYVLPGATYTYTVSASGYVTETGTYEVTNEASQTVTVSLSRESSGGGGSSTVEDPEKEYTVTFDTNGGSSVTKQTVVSGDKAMKPADPTKDGYEFAGWYADSGLTKAYDFSSKVTGSITLYAKWTEAEDDQPVQKVTFSDVPSDAWYAEYVSYLAGKGIVNGKTENTFAPDAQITRAEFVKIIAGVAGADISGSAASGFSDVASDAWYAPYVAWGVKNGIINGTSATTFNPNGNITREDMATIIKRYTDFAKFTLPTDTAAADFSDSAQISSYAADAVKAMQQANIINGKGDNTFAPKDNATRAEACKMLTVLMKMMEA